MGNRPADSSHTLRRMAERMEQHMAFRMGHGVSRTANSKRKPRNEAVKIRNSHRTYRKNDCHGHSAGFLRGIMVSRHIFKDLFTVVEESHYRIGALLPHFLLNPLRTLRLRPPLPAIHDPLLAVPKRKRRNMVLHFEPFHK